MYMYVKILRDSLDVMSLLSFRVNGDNCVLQMQV